MIAVALLMPVSMLCLLLALGRYEERMLSPHRAGKAPGARPARRLRVLPRPLRDRQDTASRTSGTPAPRTAGHPGPDGPGTQRRAA